MLPRLLLPVLALLLATPAANAAVRCDLGVPGGATGACVDPKLLLGQTLRIPSNITRIGDDGLKLCTPTNVAKLSSDIVYVIDNSASMDAWGFWIRPGTTDTLWYIPDCEDANIAGEMVAFRKRHFGGKTGADSLQWDSLFRMTGATAPGVVDAGNCKEANDPYSMRAQAVRVALDYQAQFDSGSMAGVVYFNAAVRQKFAMRALGRTGLRRLLDSTGMYDAASGTQWAPPLDTAMRWLANTPVSGRSKAIILVSDGEPSDASKYTALLGKDGQPPIYGIYLGESTDPTPQLDNVTSLTLGQKFVVPPDNPDSLEGVIKAIVASVTTKESPTTSRLTNVTNGQTSRTLSLSVDPLDTWTLQLDSVVALSAGLNSMRWITTWRGTGGIKTDTTDFVLDVSGPAAGLGSTPIAGTNFGVQCAEGSVLQFTDSSGIPTTSVTEGMGQVGLRLKPSGEALLPLRTAITSGAADREPLSLTDFDSLASGTYGRLLPLSVARFGSAAPGNQALEVRSGSDTLRSAWCHPRDARDCAEASLEVLSFRVANLRWIPRETVGSAGSLVLEATLPGQVSNSVQVSIYRKGRLVVNKTLRRVRDSIFQDTIRFVQGPRVPTGDTLRLMAPPTLVPDSMIAVLVWSLTGDTLTDTALIARPPLALRVEWTGAGQQVLVTLDGGQVDARGLRTVRLSASVRTQSLVLDSTARGSANVTALASTGSGASVWIKGLFVDPVYGDTAVDSTQVPVPRTYLRFTSRSQTGPQGSFGLEADLPGVTGNSVLVAIRRRGQSLGNVVLTRQADSTFAGTVFFRQGPNRPGADSVWMLGPNVQLPDSLAAVYAMPTNGDTLSDTALVVRPILSLQLKLSSGTRFDLALQGGFPDARGSRTVVVSVVTPSNVLLDSLALGTVDVLSQLSRVAGAQAMVRASFVDPVYGDTARDSAIVAIPVRTLTFTPTTIEGPRGALRVQVVDPWATTDSRTLLVAHGRDTVQVRLVREPTGTFAAVLPFSQTLGPLGDTLALGRPSNGVDSVYAILPRQDSLPALVARAMITRPLFRLELVPVADQPQGVRFLLAGASADIRGEAWASLTGPVALPRTQLTETGALRWDGQRDLSRILPESPDPVRLDAFFVDPIYGDTAKASLSIASPWFPARLEVYPELADPRKGDTVEIRVYDKDVDTTSVGTVKVQVGNRTVELKETGLGTGEYVVRMPAGTVDPDWGRRKAREEWTVTLVYTDPDHPRDVVRAQLRLKFNVPPSRPRALRTRSSGGDGLQTRNTLPDHRQARRRQDLREGIPGGRTQGLGDLARHGLRVRQDRHRGQQLGGDPGAHRRLESPRATWFGGTAWITWGTPPPMASTWCAR
jgi:hypothetical protein